jgi:ABC-type nitrate/sulfonate/bicarbonate transport system permease component
MTVPTKLDTPPTASAAKSDSAGGPPSIEPSPPRAERPRGRRSFSPQARDRVLAVLSPLALLVLWELASRAGVIDDRFFPPPTRIASTFGDLAKSGELWSNTWVSVRRVLLGLALGATPALIIGLAMGLYRPVRAVLDPLVAATYPIPKSAIVPLLLLIFGLGEMSKIVMVAIGAFFPVVINTSAGVQEIPPIYRDVGRNFGASRWHTFRTIALPGALPLIMTGLKLAVGLGLILIVIAEMIGAKSGLGYMIWNAWQIFAVPTMYVGLITISILGVLFTLALTELERVLIPWRRSR